MNDKQLLRYARHLNLNRIGIEGQERICASTAVVVGVGGLGCITSLLLSAAGVRQLVLIDGDRVELSNLQRQILHTTESLGTPKVTSAAIRLRALNPESIIFPVFEHVGSDGEPLMKHLSRASIVFDCTDNFETRRIVNRSCKQASVPLVTAGVDEFEGFVAGFNFGDKSSACYECLFPTTEEQPLANCALYGVFAPVVQVVGSLAVSKGLLGLADPKVDFQTLDWIDLESPSFDRTPILRNVACRVCGQVA